MIYLAQRSSSDRQYDRSCSQMLPPVCVVPFRKSLGEAQGQIEIFPQESSVRLNSAAKPAQSHLRVWGVKIAEWAACQVFLDLVAKPKMRSNLSQALMLC